MSQVRVHRDGEPRGEAAQDDHPEQDQRHQRRHEAQGDGDRQGQGGQARRRARGRRAWAAAWAAGGWAAFIWPPLVCRRGDGFGRRHRREPAAPALNGSSAGDFGGARGGTANSSRATPCRAPRGHPTASCSAARQAEQVPGEPARGGRLWRRVELEPSPPRGRAAAAPGGAVGAAGGRVASDRGEDHVLAEEGRWAGEHGAAGHDDAGDQRGEEDAIYRAPPSRPQTRGSSSRRTRTSTRRCTPRRACSG